MTPPDGLIFLRSTLRLGEQGGSLAEPNGAGIGVFVTVYDLGAFDPSTLVDKQPVTVNGTAGYFGRASTDSTEGTLLWPYAPGSWARVAGYVDPNGESPTQSEVLAYQQAVAAGVTFGDYGDASLLFCPAICPGRSESDLVG